MSDIAPLIVSLGLRDGLSSGLGRASGQLDQFSRGLGRVGKGIGQVGSGIDRILTRGALAAGAGLAAVVTTAASFEQAWAGVRKTVDGTDADLAALRDDFTNLSRTVPLSFEELSGIGAAGGALGIAGENLLDFTDIVARLAVSTDLTADTAATALGQLGNVLGLTSADMRDFADSLVALGNDGASTESEIIDLAARFGAAGRQAGLSNEAILALASTTASMAIEAEAGGGALSRVFNGITLDIGTASEQAQLMAKAMGMSLGELKTAWDRDAGKVFGDLLGYISKLDQFEAAKFLTDLGITNTRDINALTVLSRGQAEYARQLAVSTGQTNELNRESDAFFNTTAGKWQTLQNNVRIAADTIGGELLPLVNEQMDEFVGWLSKADTQTGIKSFAEDLAAGVRGLVDELKGTDWSGLMDGMKVAAEVAKGAFDLFNRLPADIKALAIGALVVNKATGGAVGSIAKGLGNIAGGLLTGGGLLGRGSSRFNPVWVQSAVGGVPGGGGGGGVPIIGGILAGLTMWWASEEARKFATENNPFTPEGPILTPDQSVFDVWAEGLNEKAETSLLTNLGQFDPRNRGGTPPMKGVPSIIEKLMTGGLGALFPKMALPNTAMSLTGGGMLPNTAMSSLKTTSTEVTKLAPILSRDAASSRLAADRMTLVNSLLRQEGDTLRRIEARPPGSVTVNVHNSVNLNASLIGEKLLQIRKSLGGSL